MKRFQFQFQTLLRMRENQRDVRRRELGEALSLEAKLRGETVSLEARRDAALRSLREIAGHGSVDVDRTLEARRYLSVLRGEIGITQVQLEAVGKEVERRRNVLIESDRAVKVLEKLRERHEGRHTEQARREEVAALDEIGGRLAVNEA